LDKLKEGSNKAFIKAGLLEKGQELKLKSKGAGHYGRVFLLDGIKTGDDQFVMKMFLNTDEGKNPYHGNFTEINIAAFWKKNVCKSINPARVYYDKNGNKINVSAEERNLIKRANRNEFFFGDIKAGYMVTRFISIYGEKPKYSFPEEILGLKYVDGANSDYEKNKINDWNVDYGGFRKENLILNQNKTARQIYKRIYKTPENKRIEVWNNFCNDKKYKNNKDIKADISASLELLPEGKDKTEGFKLLAEDSNNKVKEVLANKLELLPKRKDRIECFKILTEDIDEMLKKELDCKLHYLFKRKNWIDYLKFFIKDANNSIEKFLLSN